MWSFGGGAPRSISTSGDVSGAPSRVVRASDGVIDRRTLTLLGTAGTAADGDGGGNGNGDGDGDMDGTATATGAGFRNIFTATIPAASAATPPSANAITLTRDAGFPDRAARSTSRPAAASSSALKNVATSG